MTGPDDIEDVLSSIRRLVAGEARTAVSDQTPAPAGRAPILLLGPATRVTDVEDPFQMIHRRAQQGGSPGGPDAAPQTGAFPLDALSEATGGENALRDLIAEVVRRELSGELGERITRNVRKLVRREMRILSADADKA